MSERTEALAKSLEEGARALASFASELTEEEALPKHFVTTV
jgi:hypothetical protein